MKVFLSGTVYSGFTIHFIPLRAGARPQHMPHTFLVLQCPVIAFVSFLFCFILFIFYLFVSLFTSHSTCLLSTYYGFQFNVFSITYFFLPVLPYIHIPIVEFVSHLSAVLSAMT